MSESEKMSEKDDFWDLDMMIPQKPKRSIFSRDTNTVEITLTDRESGSSRIPDDRSETIPERTVAIPGRASETLTGKQTSKLNDPEKDLRLEKAKSTLLSAETKLDVRHMNDDFKEIRVGIQAKPQKPVDFDDLLPDDSIPGKNGSTLILEYTPENPLLRSVKISSWDYKYSFYERFRSDAKRYHQLSGKECDFQPFFSYLPQYAHLSKTQLDYYLWWRDNIRNNIYPDTSYSYILLYIFEIINLPDLIEPDKGAILLCNIWSNYRSAYPRLDRDVCEWLCDYCLIYDVHPPFELLSGFFSDILKSCTLREFYLGLDNSPGSTYSKAILNGSTTYDFRKSKFITKENRHLFEKHIRNAFIYTFSKLENDSSVFFAPLGIKAMTPKRASRDSFGSAVCAYDLKRRIDVEYMTCQRSVELRCAVTDAIKYAENQIRSLLGIRSRFHLPDLPKAVKDSIDEYFKPYTDRSKRKKAEAQNGRNLLAENDYEKEYEAATADFSPEYSKKLEEQAWSATDMLVGDEDLSYSGKALRCDKDENQNTSDSISGFFITNDTNNGSGGDIKGTAANSSADVDCKGIPGDSIRGNAIGDSLGNSKVSAADGIHDGLKKADDGTTGKSLKKYSDHEENAVCGKADPSFIVARALDFLMKDDYFGFSLTARQSNLLPDALADMINETAYDIVGDIAIENDGSGYRIIPDYIKELEEWISKQLSR